MARAVGVARAAAPFVHDPPIRHVEQRGLARPEALYAYPMPDPVDAARELHAKLATRRSTRAFSDRPVSRETVEWIVRCATSAPSGANKQPWRFVCVSDPALKKQIRQAAEAEEREFYATRASERWLADLAPLGTDPEKPFLEEAPWVVVLFKMVKADDGGQHYYVDESVGIAAGLFITAVHLAGLATLTHTPSPMKFLAEILGRPAHERAFLLLPIGHAAEGWQAPEFAKWRKPLDEVMVVRD